MIDPHRPVVADRRDPADREAGQVVRLAGRRAPDVGRAGDGRQPRDVDAVVAGDEAQQRGSGRRRGRDHEDQRLDDLAELGADARRPPRRRCGSTRRRR